MKTQHKTTDYTFDPDGLTTFKEVVLEKLKFGASQAIGSTMIDSLNLEVTEDMVGLQMLAQLKGYVLAAKIHEDSATGYAMSEHYLSWWQMFKATSKLWGKLPQKTRDKHPAQYYKQSHPVTVKFERYATYPMANIAIQENRDMFRYKLGGVEVVKDIVSST